MKNEIRRPCFARKNMTKMLWYDQNVDDMIR